MNSVPMGRLWPGVLAMALVVLASNVGVQFLLGPWLTWGAFTYPLAFLVTDVINRVYGPQAAQRVVLAGFVVGVACSLVGSQIQGEFGPLVTLRIAGDRVWRFWWRSSWTWRCSTVFARAAGGARRCCLPWWVRLSTR